MNTSSAVLSKEQKSVLKKLLANSTNEATTFNEWHQREFRTPASYEIVEKFGADHCPTVIVEWTSEIGNFRGTSSNKREAAKQAVLDLVS